MPAARIVRACSYACALALSLWPSQSPAQTVWSGLSYTFTKEDFTNALLEQNQDRITDNVWITRSELGGGLLNAATECAGIFGCEYTHNFSPEDTEWANGWFNPGATIAASNYAALTFSDWESTYGNRVGDNILDPLYRDAVVHLISDDIYLDLRFVAWTKAGGGGFTYQRAVAPAAPQTDGDYNENGVVDAADYVDWRKTLGQSASPAGSGADGDADGTIDQDDYNFWRARFGNVVAGAGGGAHAATVPEPSSAILLLMVLLVFPRRSK